MPTAAKSAAIEQLQDTFDKASAIFLADFTGLDVAQMTDLRRKCRADGVELKVVKNTLAIKATRALELTELEEHFRGPTAMAVSVEDPTSPARILVNFHKEHEKPQVKLGFVDGRILTADEVKALASLPTRDQLISQVMQLAQAPAQNFVACLNDVMTKVVRTVDAVRDAMEKGTIASAAPAEPAAEEAPAAEAPTEEASEAKTEEAVEAPEEKPAEAEEDKPEETEAGDEKPEEK